MVESLRETIGKLGGYRFGTRADGIDSATDADRRAHPMVEGTGFAGGMLSAATDGIEVAETATPSLTARAL